MTCILEPDESKKLRMERVTSRTHEDHIATKRIYSLQHYNLVHKASPIHQAMTIPEAKAAVDKEWVKLKENFGAGSGESQKQI